MMRRAALIVATAVLVGCPAEQSAGSATTSASAVAATSIPTPAASVSARRFPSPYADEDLAVPEDFEAQAEKDITSENYKAILDEMDTGDAPPNTDIPPAAASAAPGKIPAPPP
jgi:hypothetical protein